MDTRGSVQSALIILHHWGTLALALSLSLLSRRTYATSPSIDNSITEGTLLLLLCARPTVITRRLLSLPLPLRRDTGIQQ